MEQLDEIGSGHRVGADDKATGARPSDASDIELLDNTAHRSLPPPSTRWGSWRIAPLMLGLVVAYLILMLLPGFRSAEVGKVQPVVSTFGDPFAVEWIGLERPAADEVLSSALSSRPMVSVDPPCVGFARTDWPEGSQQPSVARCIESAIAADLPAEGVIVMHQSAVGSETWFSFLFGADVTEVWFEIDETYDLDAERIHIGERHAAAVIPSDYESWRITWRLAGGERYRCDFDGRPTIETSCD